MPTDARIDAYISKSAPFAQPILTHLRELVRRGCPEVEESIKWGMPHFLLNGRILCSMAAFKAHCAFGFWHKGMEVVIGKDGAKAEAAMGNLGRITSLSDLPNDRTMLRYLNAAAKLNAAEPGRPARRQSGRTAPKVPEDLAAALDKNAAAARAFAAFSPSHQREYIEWITDAKRPETRQKRLGTALEWLAKGKPRNWKYMKC